MKLAIIRQRLPSVAPTLATAAAIEVGHLGNFQLPIPFLLLIASMMYAGTTGGRIGGMLSAAICSVMLLHGHVSGFGPQMIIASLPLTLASIAIFATMGYFVGRIADQRDALMEKRLEAQRRDQEQPLLLAAKVAGMGYYIWDTVNDLPVVVSEQHARNHGASVEAFLATAASAGGAIGLVHPDDRQRVKEGCREVLKGVPVTLEYRVPVGDETRWIRASVEPQTDDCGNVVREVCASLDITEQKTNERIFAEAQRLDAVGRLTAGIAHDFNNILTVVTGNVELCRLESDSADQRELLTQALDATARGAKLTKQLLAFGRRSVLAPEALDANRVINRLDGLFRRTLPSTIRVETQLGRDLGPVKADRTQLESALLNLAINARDAMPDGGQLIVTTRSQTVTEAEPTAGLEAGTYVVISVADTGTGISETALERVFEPFYTTKPIDKGSGLGLPMVYGFVIQSGGHITLKSQPGHGTQVEMFLPRATSELETAPDDAPAPASEAVSSPVDLPEMGLLIEDPAAWQKTVQTRRAPQ
jgi:signal transduction histidine kinase